MNRGKAGWSRRYREALREHLRLGLKLSLQSASALGRQAAVLGLETLDVARIHQQALMAPASPGGSPRARRSMIERGKSFFAETILPIEKTHRAAREASARVKRLTRTLRRRSAQSTAVARRLARSIARRQAAEAALQQSGKHRARLLEGSRRLRHRLRRQMRGILSAQEAERRKTSRQLHDEIAQTLVAVNVRLLTLKAMAAAGAGTLKNEVAETQRLVEESVGVISGFAHEIGLPHEK